MAETATVSIYTAYRFLALEQLEKLRVEIERRCVKACALGTVLLAREGINAALAGSRASLEVLFADLEELLGVSLDVKTSQARKAPFARLRVRLRDEIVTFGYG